MVKFHVNKAIIPAVIVGFWVMFPFLWLGFVNFIWGGSIIWALVTFSVYSAIEDAKKKVEDEKKPEVLQESSEEFREVLWENPEGVDLTFKYKNGTYETIQRTVKVKQVIKFYSEYKHEILYDRKNIKDTEEDIQKLDKNAPDYYAEKELLKEQLREFKQSLHETAKNKKDFLFDVYLFGFCQLRQEDRVFKLDNIIDFYNNKGTTIERKTVCLALGDKKLLKYFDE